ncbi:MAG: AtpZ/AtpI family protein [Lachnospiraceae bacterium]|nr:AtpZ/AtpI family protein [Lachnospiraceae bacterium]
MKYDKSVYRSLALITQFGINMLVPVFLCTIAGIWLGRKISAEWIVIPLFLIGALAGFRNIYIMAKNIYEKDAVSARVPSIYSKQRNDGERLNRHTSARIDQRGHGERSKDHAKKN